MKVSTLALGSTLVFVVLVSGMSLWLTLQTRMMLVRFKDDRKFNRSLEALVVEQIYNFFDTPRHVEVLRRDLKL